MIAAEALGLNTCPMEGFDGRRLSKFLHSTPAIMKSSWSSPSAKKSCNTRIRRNGAGR